MLQPKKIPTPDEVLGKNNIPSPEDILGVEKKNPNGTATTQKKSGESVQTIGSSGTAKQKFRLPNDSDVIEMQKQGKLPKESVYSKPKFNEKEVYDLDTKGKVILPSDKQVKKNEDSIIELNKIVGRDSRRATDLELNNFKNSTSLTPQEIEEIMKEVDDEINKNGFWNTAKDYGKKALNVLSSSVARMTDEEGLDKELHISTDPLSDYKQEFINKQKENGVDTSKLSKEDIFSGAKNLLIKDKKDKLKKDKTSLYIDSLSDDEKNALNLTKLFKRETLNEKDKVYLANTEISKQEIENTNSEIKRIVDKFNKKEDLSESEVEFAKNYEENAKKLAKEYNENYIKYQKNNSELGDVAQEYDLLKRDYDITRKSLATIGGRSAQILYGLATVSNDILNPYEESRIAINDKLAEANSKVNNLLENNFQKNTDGWNGEGDAFEYVVDVISNQLPNLALMAVTGGSSQAIPLLAIGAYSAGNNINDLTQSNNEGKTFYSEDQIRKYAYIEGAGEMLETGTMGNLVRFNKFMKASFNNPQTRELFLKTTKESLANSFKLVGKGLVSENAEELGTMWIDIIAKEKFLGVKTSKKEIADLTERTLKDTSTMSLLMSGAPQIAHQVMKAITPKSYVKKLDENTKEILRLSGELKKTNLTKEESDIIKKSLDNKISENKKMLENVLDGNKNLDDEQRKKAIDLELSTSEIRNEATSIKKSTTIDKDVKIKLLKDLEVEYKKQEALRENIASGTASILDIVSEDKKEKMKSEALKTLLKENPNTNEANFTNEKIEQKAIELYKIDQLKIKSESNEQTKPQESVGQESEAQPQAEVETKVTEVSSAISELEKQRDAEIEALKSKRQYDEKNITPIKEKYNALILKEKAKETEAKIKRKDLFQDGGTFSNQLGESSVDSVPTNHQEINGIEFVEFSNPNTGVVDVIMSGTSDSDFVGYYRVYENGKPTEKWSSKFENQSRNKENFKTMISGVQSMLPKGHLYTEKTSISTDGLRVWEQQLSRGYEMQTDNNGNIVTNEVAINGDAINNELGIDVNQGNFDNISVTNNQQFETVKKALLPYLEKLGLTEQNIRWENGTVFIDLPVLKQKTNNESTSSSNTSTNGNVRPGNESMGEVASQQQTASEIDTKESIQSTNDVRPTEGETQVETARNFKREKGKSSVLKRIREGGNSKEINKIIDRIGLNYEGRKQEQVYADGVNFVKEVGIAEAYNAIKSGELKDSDTINVVYATILQEFSKMVENEISKVSDPQELSELMNELDDLHIKIYSEFKARTIDAGRGSAILNFIYNQDLKIKYSLSQQIENFKKVNNGVIPEEVLAKLKELDKKYQEASKRVEELESLLKEAQEQKDFENIVEEEKRQPKFSKTRRERAEKIIKALDDFERSILKNSYSDATLITPILIQGIRATKLAIKQGVNIADAIEKGIDGIKKELSKLGKNFDNEERFRNDLSKSLEGIDVETKQPKTEDEIYKEKVEAKINSLQKRIDDVKTGKVKDTEGNSSVWSQEISELQTELKNLKNDNKVVSEPKITVDKNGKVRIPTEIIKDFISKGGTDLSEFAKQAQESIKDEFPNVSVRDIRESVANYGKKVNKTKTQIIEDIQKLKLEEILRLEYEDLQNRISKEKNEAKKRTLSQTETRLKAQIKQLQDDLGITESERTNRSVNYTKKRIETLKEKIKNNDFAKKEVKPIVESKELRDAKIEKNRVQEEFDYLSYEQEIKNRTFGDKAKEFAKDIYDSQRVTLATGEMSFVGAQGGFYMVDSTFSRKTLENLIKNFKGTTSKEWRANPFGTALKMIKSAHSSESLMKMFSTMGTANNYLDFQRMLKEDVNYDLYLKSGLRILGEDVKSQVKDDNFIGNNILTLLKIPIHLIDRIEKQELKKLKLSFAETEKKRTTLQGFYEKLKTGKISDKNKKTATEIFSNANPLSTFERGNTVFMNMARIEMFNKYASGLYASGKNPIDHLSDFKKLGSAINTITGSGNMNQTVTMALPVLNKVMFSARYFASSWNLTPPFSLYYLAKLGNYDGVEINSPSTWKNLKPTVAQKAFVKPMIKGFVAFYGLSLMTMAMINASIDDDDEMPEEEKKKKRAYIEYDPSSSNFMQVISGNVRTDYFGPYRGNVVLLSKLLTGQSKNKKGEIVENGADYGSRTDFQIGTEYLAGKANPFPGMFIRYSQGKKEDVLNLETGKVEEKRMLFGKEIGIGYQMKNNVLPIFVTTVKDITNEDPVLGATFYNSLALFGKESSVYKDSDNFENKQAKLAKEYIIEKNKSLETITQETAQKAIKEAEGQVENLKEFIKVQKTNPSTPYYISKDIRWTNKDLSIEEAREMIIEANEKIKEAKIKYNVK